MKECRKETEVDNDDKTELALDETQAPTEKSMSTTDFDVGDIELGKDNIESEVSTEKSQHKTKKPNKPKKSDRSLSSSRSNEEKSAKKVEASPELIIVNDLTLYEGNTLKQQVQSFIKRHNVSMINRSWCLFSNDAIDFLVGQIGVSVHSLEIDLHPQGAQILKHVEDITNYKTTPAIFIKGEFLGGFQEVNKLYSTGSLQQNYIAGISQADRCEIMISGSEAATKTLFWFPQKVDGNAVQCTGAFISVMSATSAASVGLFHQVWGTYIAYFLLFDFLLRVLGGGRASILGRFAMVAVHRLQPRPRSGRPKQFAQMCGVTFSLLGTIFYSLTFEKSNAIGAVIMAMLAIASGLEGFFDFCVGCVIFHWGIKVGIFNK